MNKKAVNKTYNAQQVKTDGNVISFDGQYNAAKNELTVNRIYGDVRLYNQAIQDFCIDNKIATAIIKY